MNVDLPLTNNSILDILPTDIIKDISNNTEENLLEDFNNKTGAFSINNWKLQMFLALTINSEGEGELYITNIALHSEDTVSMNYKHYFELGKN